MGRALTRVRRPGSFGRKSRKTDFVFLAAHPFTKEKRYEFEESGNDGSVGGCDSSAGRANSGLARARGRQVRRTGCSGEARGGDGGFYRDASGTSLGARE